MPATVFTQVSVLRIDPPIFSTTGGALGTAGGALGRGCAVTVTVTVGTGVGFEVFD